MATTNKNPSPKEANTPKKYKIFIIEDDKFFLDMLSMKFAKAGHEVDSAQSGTEALNKIHDGYVPDIIVCDIIMPGMSGIELLEAIRKEKLIPQVIVIMFTNNGEPAGMTKANSLGAAGYIVKATKLPSEVVEEVLKTAGKRK